MAFRIKPRNFYRLLRDPPLLALQGALASWRHKCPRCPQMPPEVRTGFLFEGNVEPAMQWLRENSEPCPHGASFEELRALVQLPVRRKLPKHIRAYLEEAISKGLVAVVMSDEGIRYVAKQRAPTQ